MKIRSLSPATVIATIALFVALSGTAVAAGMVTGANILNGSIASIDVMNETGSRDLKIWLADGTNYPGQDDMRGRQDRLADSLQKIYDRIGPEQRLVLEYKFFEPAFYHTDVPDWGTSYAQVAALGDRAMVCLDTGHHAPGTNIEFIVATLLRLGKLGSFDFNSRFYADDDLIVGAADPFQLFRILFEVIRGGGYGKDSGVAFMLDQCHNIEDKIPGQIRSVLNVQEMTARALLVEGSADPETAVAEAEERAQPPPPPPPGERSIESWVLPAIMGVVGLGLGGLSIYALLDENCERFGETKCLRGDRPNIGLGAVTAIVGGLLIAGAIVWLILGLHTAHIVTDFLDSTVLAALMFVGPVEEHRFVDVEENAVYWYFVVLAWLPIYGVIYWAPRVL